MPAKQRFSPLKWRTWPYVALLGLWLGLAIWPGHVAATQPAVLPVVPSMSQTTAVVALTVQLRHSDGTAVIGETVTLERPPEAEPIPPTCVTDDSGSCRWWVGRGVYQLRFTRPLDEISALALAEGGLNGLGITVGDTAVSYHFTFHSDGRVYFDAAPEAAVPQPVLPAGELWHGGILPTLTPTVETVPPEAAVLASPEAPAEAEASPAGSQTPWRLLGYIGGGLLLSILVHLCQQRRRRLAAAEANRD